MILLKNFIYSPGGENESGATPSNSNEDQKDSSAQTPESKKEDKEKPVVQKIKDALQDWSNKDELDQEFDDTRV